MVTITFTESEIKILALGLRKALIFAEEEKINVDEICNLIDKIYCKFKRVIKNGNDKPKMG